MILNWCLSDVTRSVCRWDMKIYYLKSNYKSEISTTPWPQTIDQPSEFWHSIERIGIARTLFKHHDQNYYHTNNVSSTFQFDVYIHCVKGKNKLLWYYFHLPSFFGNLLIILNSYSKKLTLFFIFYLYFYYEMF